MVSLTQKERMLLEDQKSHEEICIKKYNDYANQASDPKLSQMFKDLAQQEQQHLDTVNSILSGQVPAMNSQQQAQGQQQSQQQSTMTNMSNVGTPNANDKFLCSDLLSTEKYISNTYDTTIFECKDTSVRDALNHIQKEEQQHGEQIFDYMQSHGMYTPK